MDVTGPPGSGLNSPSWFVLFGIGAAQLPTENALGWYPPVRDKEKVSRRHSTSGQRSSVPPHLRHKFTQTERSPFW